MKTELQSGSLEGLRTLKMVPLVIRYAAGVPSIVFNPANESITLTDVGTGDVLLTFASAGLAPLMVMGAAVLAAAPATLGNIVQLKSAPTTTAVALLVQSGADGATAVDPVDLHVTVLKYVQG